MDIEYFKFKNIITYINICIQNKYDGADILEDENLKF